MSLKPLVIFIAVFTFVLFGTAQKHEILFSVPWGTELGQIGLEVIHEGNQSHEEGYFTLRYGPDALAVSQDKIFILDQVNHRVAVFDHAGKWVTAIALPTPVNGLAVSEDGILAAYSSMEKYAIILYPQESATKIMAPAEFAALSEVWWQDGTLWGRYGWQTAPLTTCENRNVVVATAVTVQESQVAVALSGSRDAADYTVIEVPGEICTAYAAGRPLPEQKVAVVVEQPSNDNPRARKTQILMVDTKTGKTTHPITLAQSWTQCFCTYTIRQDGTVYEMFITPKGVMVRQWTNDAPSMQNRKVRGQVPASEILPTSQVPQEGSRTTVNVWFRNSGVKTMDLDTYLKGVVSQEIYSSWELTAHKSMAVAARTYAMARYRHPDKNAHVCDTTCCQAWTSNPNPRAIEAVQATSGKYVTRNGSHISEPLYFSHCNGNTRNSENYDSWNYIVYLRSRPCACGWTSYYGHGVGMCQYGMQAYALQGKTYIQIIEHYYTGCTVGN